MANKKGQTIQCELFVSVVFLELFRQCGIFRTVPSVWYFQNCSVSVVFLFFIVLLYIRDNFIWRVIELSFLIAYLSSNRFFFNSSCLYYLRYLSQFTYTIVVFNTCFVVFLLCFSSSCVPYVASFSGLSIFNCPFGIL